MTKEQKLELLKKWVKTHDDIEKNLKPLKTCFDTITGPLFSSIWNGFTNYTNAVSMLVGDKSDWLSWYCYDCDMGKTPKQAGYDDNLILISNLDSLIELIES